RVTVPLALDQRQQQGEHRGRQRHGHAVTLGTQVCATRKVLPPGSVSVRYVPHGSLTGSVTVTPRALSSLCVVATSSLANVQVAESPTRSALSNLAASHSTSTVWAPGGAISIQRPCGPM